MTITIKKGRANGKALAPPSKSYAHRLLIGGALCRQGAAIGGISGSEDMLATLDCIKALGADFNRIGDAVVFKQAKAWAQRPTFPCRDSGSTLRFFIPIACVLCGGGIFSGSPRLIERGIGIYEEIFEGCGIGVLKGETSIEINGYLRAGDYSLKGNISSQFITGLLFALSLLEGNSIIRVIPPFESQKYVDITIESMAQFGVLVERVDGFTFKIRGCQGYFAESVKAEGDWSNAAFLFALNTLGGEVLVEGLNEFSLQGDRCCIDYFERIKRGETLDISECPDLGPVLFSIAAAFGKGRFTGTRRLEIKESNRAAAMAEELSKFGVKTVVNENSVDIYCDELRPPKEILCGHNDHRIIMALAVLLTLTGGKINGAEAVGKSYPEFFDVLKSLGLEVGLDA